MVCNVWIEGSEQCWPTGSQAEVGVAIEERVLTAAEDLPSIELKYEESGEGCLEPL